LVEIVEEAWANGTKVIVFSYFLKVLETIHNAKASPNTKFPRLDQS